MHSIIGAGIAGLSCSISLTEKNIDHEIFDKYSKNCENLTKTLSSFFSKK